MDTNKQENHILPECCQHCVEADGFQGAKSCSNRECECHKESQEGVEEEKVFRAFLQLLNDEQFVSSTDSVTGETVEFPDAVEDREATIAISGEYDTELLKKAVCGFVRDFTSLNTKNMSKEDVEETCKDAVCHHCPYFLPDCKHCHSKLTSLNTKKP